MADPRAPSNVITEHPNEQDKSFIKKNQKLNEKASKRQQQLRKDHKAAGKNVRTGR